MTDNIIGEIEAFTFNSSYNEQVEVNYNRSNEAVQAYLQRLLDEQRLNNAHANDVGIWNRILTADEIETLRESGIFYDYTPEAKIANWKEHMTR